MLFFALVYLVEGIGQSGGLIAQPLSYYLKQEHGWTPLQVTASLTILNLPWVIKPVYGLVSDFLPLFGYRRKAYLILANAAAVAAYGWIAQLAAPGQLIFALLLTAYAMAVSSTLCGAVLVENGQRFHRSDAFVNQQWLWFNIAAMASAFLGGQLVARLPPISALHAAAAIIAVAPLAVVVGTVLLLDEPRTPANLAEFKKALSGLRATFTVRDLWLIAAFLFLYYLNPGFGTPLYYHMTDNLKFSQDYIGILGAISSGGWIAGALLYRRFLKRLTSKALLNFSILLGTVTTAAYLLLTNEATAAADQFLQRHRRDDRVCRDLDPGRRLLPAAGGGVRLRRADVDHQFVGRAVRQHRRLFVRACVRQPSGAAGPRLRGVHRGGVRAGAVAAARAEAPGRTGARRPPRRLSAAQITRSSRNAAISAAP